MNEHTGQGMGRCRRGRGRPRAKRLIENPCEGRCFKPSEDTGCESESVLVLSEEIEAIRLVDLMDHDQESAAAEIGISRRTLWRDLHNGRKKIADALINGKSIEIISENNEL